MISKPSLPLDGGGRGWGWKPIMKTIIETLHYNDISTASGDFWTGVWFIQSQVGALDGAPKPTEAQA